MANNQNYFANIVTKAKALLANFVKTEDQLKTKANAGVEAAVQKSNQRKIEALKNKISKL
jgi:cell fate (sporulation/competence/biofilm development) regulator YlbF (YheA/YmcA/DUF963 family)